MVGQLVADQGGGQAGGSPPGPIAGRRFFDADRGKRPIARGGVEQGTQATLLYLDLDGGFALGQVELLAF